MDLEAAIDCIKKTLEEANPSEITSVDRVEGNLLGVEFTDGTQVFIEVQDV